LTPGAWAKPKYKVLALIPGGLWSGLTFDSEGNLYGATSGGGDYGYGSVFEMTRDSKGQWTVTTLHSFDFRNDGESPNGGLIFDAAGNLYGTTPNGGAYDGGTVFELSPGSSGWTFSMLYAFCKQYGCPDGGGPSAGLVQDRNGNLLGTGAGGLYDLGVVYELTPGSSGWTYSILYNFGSRPRDGSDPLDMPIFDKAGNLYGTTNGGGAYGGGTVFMLAHTPSDAWKERILYSFCPAGFPCNDGLAPYAGVILDDRGNLYGTTTQGGYNTCGETHCGTAFKLASRAGGQWVHSILYDFPKPENGSFPTGGVVRDKAGNLYGATVAGGIGYCSGGCGVAYKLEPRAHRVWKYNVLHRFTGGDGWQPLGGLIFDNKGNLYGTAYSVVYEITP